jgi:hypothetical protein
MRLLNRVVFRVVLYLGILAGFWSNVGYQMPESSLNEEMTRGLPADHQAGPELAAPPLRPAKQTQPAAGPLWVHPTNPRYFTADGQTIVYLTGSHTWANLVDHGQTNPPPVFDYAGYLDFLEANNHNFFRLWSWEQTKYAVWDSSPDFTFGQSAYQRPGPGTALDGRPKFDLDKFDQSYFDRMRQRIIAARERGMYVSVMLFDGWSPVYPKGGFASQNSWLGHPFNGANNINGIDGDLNGDDNGVETHELHQQNPAGAAVLALQKAYIRKVVNTVNDLDNVLYEISNESDGTSTTWQYHLIDYLKTYEATKAKQHPVGMTVEWPGGDNSRLYASNADWISPNGSLDPPPADGSKVILADTDHLCGICGDRQWVWKSFVQGENPIFMDGNDGAAYGWHPDDPQWASLRANLGYTRVYANRINLVAMTPRGDLCSSGYCLANPVASGAEYLVYLPNGGSVTVNLAATSETLTVEWFDPATGNTMAGGTVNGGAGNQNFTSPFGADAVLYLYVPDTTPPQISGVAAAPSDTSATVTWNTNEPASGQVTYGISPTLSMSTAEVTNLTTGHELTLTGLLSNTTYVYRAISKDGAGNQATSKKLSFTTLLVDTVPPLISNLAATAAETEATITWDTNEPATGQVTYGISPTLTMTSTEITNLTTGHEVILTGLLSNTTYVYRAISKDAAGNPATSATLNFATLAVGTAPPIIFNLKATALDTSATITWKTNEPATGRVTYGISPTLTMTTSQSLTYLTAHTVTLTGLISETTYVYQALATDETANKTNSATLSFTTLSSQDVERAYLPVILKD